MTYSNKETSLRYFTFLYLLACLQCTMLLTYVSYFFDNVFFTIIKHCLECHEITVHSIIRNCFNYNENCVSDQPESGGGIFYFLY